MLYLLYSFISVLKYYVDEARVHCFLKTQGAVASWVRMVFKPRKSRGMVIWKGTLTDVLKLKVQGEDIPIIRENPIKCLGKWYDDSLSDSNIISRTKKTGRRVAVED